MHDSTVIMCAAFAVDNEPVQLWSPQVENSDEILNRLRVLLETSRKIIAHNAQFERAILKYASTFGLPKEYEPNVWICSMAMCALHGLPRNLEEAALAIGTNTKKDMSGAEIMKRLSKPGRDGKRILYMNAKEEYHRMYSYCQDDVKTMRDIVKFLAPGHPASTDFEHPMWELDWVINDRGVCVDVERAAKYRDLAQAIAAKETEKAMNITGVSPTQVAKTLSWLQEAGAPLENLQQATIRDYLESADYIPEDIQAVLTARQLCGKTSTAKFSRFIDFASDGVARGQFVYHGADTGRWASFGIQLQNIARPISWVDMDDIINACDTSDLDLLYFIHPNPNMVLSSALRGLLIPREGYRYAVADYAGIEARVLSWLAGSASKIQLFIDNSDPYKDQASKIYDVPVGEVTPQQRQIGKVAELALGYGGGRSAFMSMGSAYGLSIEEVSAEQIKIAWRKNNPEITQFWKSVEFAVRDAIVHQKATDIVNGIGVAITIRCNRHWLEIVLPSGRILRYTDPRIEIRNKTFHNLIEKSDGEWVTETKTEEMETITYMAMKTTGTGGRKWCRTESFGGKFVENITQAVARDILAAAMLRIETEYSDKYRIVLHVHDEVVAETKEDSCDELESIMEVIPAWAAGLPIKVEGFICNRYRK